MESRNCKTCGKLFFKPYNCSKKDWVERYGRYCSKECINKGRTPWNKGTKGLQTAWNKGIPSLKKEKSKSWKGDNVGYAGLHKWVYDVLGKPNICEHCGVKGTGNKMHWANKSKCYKRDVNDWIRLCPSCHIKYDRK